MKSSTAMSGSVCTMLMYSLHLSAERPLDHQRELISHRRLEAAPDFVHRGFSAGVDKGPLP